MDTQTTAKHIWHNAEQMHKVIEDERKADSGYFDEPPIKKVVIEDHFGSASWDNFLIDIFRILL